MPISISEKLGSFFGSFNLANPSWDLFIIVFFAAAVFIYGMSLGRDRNLLILLTIYIAMAIAQGIPRFRLPRIGAIELAHLFDFKLAVFLLIFLLLFIFLSRSTVLRGLAHVGSGSLFQVFLYSFLHVGLLLSVTLSLLPENAELQFAPLTREVFTSDLARLIWLVLPVMSMVIVPAERKRPHGGP